MDDIDIGTLAIYKKIFNKGDSQAGNSYRFFVPKDNYDHSVGVKFYTSFKPFVILVYNSNFHNNVESYSFIGKAEFGVGYSEYLRRSATSLTARTVGLTTLDMRKTTSGLTDIDVQEKDKGYVFRNIFRLYSTQFLSEGIYFEMIPQSQMNVRTEQIIEIDL